MMEELDEWGLLDEPRTREVRRKVQHLIHSHHLEEMMQHLYMSGNLC